MVYRKGAFVAGQLQMVINTGKRAEKRLAKRDYHGNVEKAELLRDVEVGKKYEKMLEEHKKKNGL
jgi:hypothetical protein